MSLKLIRFRSLQVHWFAYRMHSKLDTFEAEVHGFRGSYIICPCLLEANIALEVGQHFVKKNALEIIEYICHE